MARAPKWRLYSNRSWTKSNGHRVIQSRLKPWYALFLAGAFSGIALLQLPPVPGILALALTGSATVILGSLGARIEIGAGQLVLWRYGWARPAIRVQLEGMIVKPAEITARGADFPPRVGPGLTLELGATYESEQELLFITYQGKEVSHLFDDGFAWEQLQVYFHGGSAAG